MNKFKVVIIDDEMDLLDLCSEVFSSEGCEVVSFACPLKALAFLEQNDVDAIISDSIMPNMTGLELFEKFLNLAIESDRVMPPFFLSTGQVDLDERSLCQRGLAKVILKPFDIYEMADDVIAHIKKSA